MNRTHATRPLRLAACGVAAALLAGCATSSGDPTRPAASIRGTALMNVADRTAQSGDDATAVSLYREAHNQNPADAAPLLGMGAALFRLGAYEQAAEAYRQAINLKGGAADARRGLGNALVALDRPALAVAQLTAALALKKDARTYNGLGVAYDMQGEHAHAQAMYRAGLALKPGDLALENNLGLSLAAAGAYREAVDVLAKAAAQPDAGPRERNNLALAYGLAGDTANAARIARRDMDEAAVQKNLAMYAALRARNLGTLPVSGKKPAPDATAPKTVGEAAPAAAAPKKMADARPLIDRMQPIDVVKPKTSPPAPIATAVPAKTEPKAPTPIATTAPAKTEPKAPTPIATTAPAKTEPKAPTPIATAVPAKTEPRAPASVATAMPAKAEPKAPAPDPALVAAMYDYPKADLPAPAAPAATDTKASSPDPDVVAMYDYPNVVLPAPAKTEPKAPAPIATSVPPKTEPKASTPIATTVPAKTEPKAPTPIATAVPAKTEPRAPAPDPALVAAMYDYPKADLPVPAAPAAKDTKASSADPDMVAMYDDPDERVPAPSAKSAAPATVRNVTQPTPPARNIAPLGGGVAFRPGALPEPVSFAATPLHGVYYRARLAEYPTRVDATHGWVDMVKRAPELYGAVEIVAERTALAEHSLRYTLVTAPVAERATVVKMCVTLQSRGIVCRVEAARGDAALAPRG